MTSPLNTSSPFAAVPGEAIDFQSLERERVVMAFHDADLPLVVGHAKQGLRDMVTDWAPSISGSGLVIVTHIVVGASDKVKESISQDTRWHGDGAQPHYRNALLQAFEAYMKAVTQWDRLHFGKQSHVLAVAHHEMVSADAGRHRQESGRWHRDFDFMEMGDIARLYSLRVGVPADIVRNEYTRHLPTEELKRPCFQWTGPVERHDGAIILMRGGGNGTVHRSHRPEAVAAQPSLFLFAAIAP